MLACLSIIKRGSVKKVGREVGIITKSALKIKVLSHSPFSSFEHIEISIVTCKAGVHLIVIYRPPPSKKNGLLVPIFLSEFAMFLESARLFTYFKIGDFNFHLDNPNDSAAHKFLDILNSNNLVQSVCGASHTSGHTLDLVSTRSSDSIILNWALTNPCISDHEDIVLTVALDKSPNVTKTVKYRPIAKVNLEDFNRDLKESVLVSNAPSDLVASVSLYHSELSCLPNKHVPLKSKSIVERTGCKWFSSELGAFKCQLRALECKPNATRLIVDKEIYKAKTKEYNVLRCRTKLGYYTDAVLENRHNQGKLFSIINQLLHCTGSSPLPDAESNEALTNDFPEFVFAKIAKIHDHLAAAPRPDFVQPDPPHCVFSLNEFAPVSVADIAKTIKGAPIKVCYLDPIPMKLFKSAMDNLILVIADIVNESLHSGAMPDSIKEAMVLPLLKKTNLDVHDMGNYCPVSNLPYISKVIEWVVANQLVSHLAPNSLG